MVHRGRPRDRPAPVVTNQQRRLGATFPDETTNVCGQSIAVVVRDSAGSRGQVVAAHVRHDDTKPGRYERLDLTPPAEPELGKAVQQNNERSIAGFNIMQLNVIELGVALTESALLI